MAALTAKRETRTKGTGRRQEFQVAAATTIFAGGMVCLNTGGFAVPAADTVNFSTVKGIAIATIDNSGGANGDLNVEVNSGILALMTGVAVVQGSLDLPSVRVSDDQTVALAGGQNIQAGIPVEIESANRVWVYIPEYGATL